MAFDGGSIYAKLYLDREPFQESADKAIAEGEALEGRQFDLKIGADQTPLDEGLAEAEAKAQALADKPVEIPVELDTSGLAAAAQEASNALSDAFSTEGIGRQIGRLLGQGLSPADAQDYLVSIVGFSAKDARSVMADYFDRQAATAAAERSSAVADAMAAAMLPTEEQFRRAYEAGAYRLLGAAGSKYSQGYGFDLLSPTAAAMSGLRGPLALPAAGQTTVGLGPGDPFYARAGAPRDVMGALTGDIAQQLQTGAMFTLPGLPPGLQAFAPGGVGGGIGGGGGGTASGGFMGRAANLEEARILRALGVGSNLAGGIAMAMPVLLSLGGALFVAAAGMTALGIAAAPTATEIGKGVQAVDQANTALSQAVPGTTQWASALQGVSSAWAGIDPALQGSVAQILHLFSGGSPVGNQVQNWLTGDISAITGFLSGHRATSMLMPLMRAAEGAVNSIPGVISRTMGWGSSGAGAGGFLSFIARDVRPATDGLAQLAGELLRIVSALAQMGTGGEGLRLLDETAKTVADLLHAGLVQGFFHGFVEVDRVVLSILDNVVKIVDTIDGSSKSHSFTTLGEGLGAAYGVWRMARLFGMAGGPSGTSRTGRLILGGGGASAAEAGASGAVAADATAATEGGVTGIAGPWGIAAIGAFLAANYVSQRALAAGSHHPNSGGGILGWLYRFHHRYPVHPMHGPAWLWDRGVHYVGGAGVDAANAIAGIFGAHDPLGPGLGTPGAPPNAWAAYRSLPVQNVGLQGTRAAYQYRLALEGATLASRGLYEATQNLITADEQIGGALAHAAYGTGQFTKLAISAPQSFASMVSNLRGRNTALEGWANDAQMLLRKGANPQFISDLAAQAPQDLATMAHATTAQMHAMMLAWNTQLILGQLAVKQNFRQMTSYIAGLLNTTSGVAHQAALNIARALMLPIPGIEGAWRAATNSLAFMIGSTASQAQRLMSSAQGALVIHAAHLPHRALGGPVSALQAYLVGERGPELFVPGQSGAIVPNSAIGGSPSAGTGPSVQVNLYIDATGATDPASVQRAVKSAAASVIPQLRQAVKQGIGRLPR